ncbi:MULTISPECIES: glycoside hydrolase family 32 protein [Turicibacter]|jgi:sucrose-6-phosphate hydrolase|uniref:Sucrose-6-phosphate hydrolase n=2 Tax=Turicibacter sanguinis TaxID=154288 RepID=A0A173TCZ9_9FIRM|nr:MULTISPECIES: sucrose-6-phosphate hydrolase [Turicibacter]EFF64048.1 sucrose-6-phosphate hydrolase [Turicibacter sanguinis PC909]EGC92423.1 sucrose-6-phosphate hydrolase [Turicibacter sp. HGF1]MBP3903816.1 sucrose-6-phosphate hydrolase [Turicibacter sp.]MCU7190874.1 sucrose-6-phosphate hydrolase [Turicibacter sanguinis]MCU7195722.1 sucrose-6-phosphate hydrolase [Turicibacter sanguinis]
MRYKEPKHRTILEATTEELVQLLEKSKDDNWKPIYHIHPEFGLLNDPNGLAYFNGYYHLFHQWYPFGTTHGMKHWAHLKSKNLVEWTREEVALIPTEDYEAHGAYSGTAIEINNQLYLYYTGNIKLDKFNRSANQCLAIMDDKGNIQKHPSNALIEGVPQGYTGHVRDPKVFKKNGQYYMILGAQRLDETGTFIMYQSPDGVDWSFLGELTLKNFNQNLGYMWECPDFAEIDGKDLLIFSPQGVEVQGEKYKNLFNVTYVIGKLDLDQLIFEVESFDEFERGFDFYATQTFKGKENQTLLLAWAGLGEFEYPTDIFGWAHCLTFPREIRIKDNKVIQIPAKELELLRLNKVSEAGQCQGFSLLENDTNTYELNMILTPNDANIFGINLSVSKEERLVLEFNQKNQTVTLDRSELKHQFVEEFGTYRQAELKIGEKIEIKVLMDNSIVEIFINNGELAFTSRLFPLENSTNIEIFSDGLMSYKYEKYLLKHGI